MSTLLRVQRLGRRFGGLMALHDLDLELPAGARHAIIGPNGAGKTTLLNLVAGTLRPSHGTITYEGDDITRLSVAARARRGIGRTFQHPAVFQRLTVTDNLALATAAAGLATRSSPSRGSRRDRVAQSVHDTGLSAYSAVPAGRLPYGQQRRLELAMVLAAGPRLLLLDEPSAGLDPDEVAHLTNLLTGPATTGVGVLLVDHNLDLVWSFANTVTVLHHGRHLATGRPDAVRADSQVQAAYLSTGERQPARQRPIASAATSLLRVRHLRAGFHGAPVIDGVDLDVNAGEAVAILGRNGAGKTTLLNAVAGLQTPWPGSRVYLAGRAMVGRRPHQLARAGLAIVPQGRRLFAGLTVTEHLTGAAAVRHGGPRYDRSPRWTIERVLTLLPALAERSDHPVQRLSGGEQQMLALARALLTNPRLMVLDEPSEGLAPAIISRLEKIIVNLVADGLAVLIAEQNLALASAVADRLVVLNRGTIALEIPTERLSDPAHRNGVNNLLGIATSRHDSG